MNALVELPDVEVTVVAPAEDQSGTSMSLSEGELISTPATTLSGSEAIAVAGFPADSVKWALENLDTDFDISVDAVTEWIIDNREAYAAATVSLTSINSTTCPDGGRGEVVVPLGAFNGRDDLAFDCASVLENPVDDVDAFANGFTAITDLPIQL